MRGRVRLLVLVLFLAIWCGGMAGNLGATGYFYQDLTKQGVPTGTDYYPTAINNAKQIVCYSWDYLTSINKSFIWEPKKGLTQLQTLGGKNCYTHGINKQGQIVGYADPTTGSSRACLWNYPATTPTDLGTLSGHTSSRANAINDSGLIVGDSSGMVTHACKWTAPLSPVDLGTLGGTTSSALGVNNAGQIVGSAVTTTGHTRAAIWHVGQVTPQELAASLPDGNAKVISSQGNVAGSAQFSPGMGLGHAYFWNHLTGGFQDMFPTTYESSPFGISNNGQVLCYTGMGTSNLSLWTTTSGGKDLNKLVVNLPAGVTLNGPIYAAISPGGYITAVDSQRHLCLLTPIVSPSAGMLLLD